MTWTYRQSESGDGGHLYELANDDTGEVLGPFVSPSGVNAVLSRPGLEKWLQWGVTYGVASRPDLVKLALSGGPLSDEVKQATSQALAAGKAAANEGTAYHKVAEQVSTAADAFNIAAELRPWAERFGRMLDDHGIVIRQREVVVFNFDHGYAGTADVMALHLGHKRIGDTKTGKRPYFEAAMQIAAYANAEVALVDGELIPLPADMDKETGLVFHVPADGETADVVEIPLTDAWEAFKAACCLKKILDAQPKGPVGEVVEPTHRFTDTYVDWIRARLAEHKADAPAIVTQFSAWKLAAFGDKPSAEMTTDELEACLTALCDLEAREQVPFAADYPHPNGPRISSDTADQIRDRIAALPDWLRTEVLAQRSKMQSIDLWRVTDAEEFEQVLGPAESARDSLAQSIDTLMREVDGDTWLAVSQMVGHSNWSWTEFDLASRIIEAVADGWLIAADDSLTIAPTIVDRLVDKHGSKADATKAIRERVAELGLDIKVPRSLGDCCADPVLVALAA